MTTLSVANPTLLIAGISGFTLAYEMLQTNNYIGAGIAGVLGIMAVILYDRLPSSQA